MFLKASTAVFCASGPASRPVNARRTKVRAAILTGIQRTSTTVIASAVYLAHLKQPLRSTFIFATSFQLDSIASVLFIMRTTQNSTRTYANIRRKGNRVLSRRAGGLGQAPRLR